MLQVLERLDRRTVDGNDTVVHHEAGPRSGTVGHDGTDNRQGDGDAQRDEQAREQNDRQYEIGDRPGCDNDCPRQHRFVMEGLTGDPRGANFIRHILRPLLPVQLHVATEGKPCQLPNGAVRIGPGRDRVTEADRESLHADAAPASREVMAEFMNEDEHTEDDDERRRAANEIGNDCQHGRGSRVGVIIRRERAGYG